MKLYRTIVRTLLAVTFIGGCAVHIISGRTRPGDYAAFGETALPGWLTDLWTSWVMPNISWLTIVMGLLELAWGVGLIVKRTVPYAAAAAIAFFVFLTALGCGFPTTTFPEDLLKNRLPALLALLTLPLLLEPRRRDPAASTTARS
jgi:uncharacterized membrane protein